jgi:hypothetical protein
MSLIDEIKKYLPADVVSKLASTLGVNESQATSAIGAAVPSMLSGVSQMAQTGDGANKLASALKGMDLSALSNPMQALTGGGGLGDIGGKLLGNLFGGSVLGKLGDTIGKFSGLGGGASKLLGLIAPFVMGGLAKKWMGSGGTPTAQGLTGLLNAEKSNIAAAMPSGFSLGNMFSAPSMPNVPSMPSAPQGGGLLKILLPILGILALAAVGYYAWTNFSKPTVPSVPKIDAKLPDLNLPDVKLPELTGEAKTVGDGLTSTFSGLTETLSGIKDAAGADEAMKKVPEMATKLDGVKAMFDKLPGGGIKDSIIAFIKSKIGGLKGLLETAMKLPGIGDKLKPVNGLMEKLDGFAK